MAKVKVKQAKSKGGLLVQAFFDNAKWHEFKDRKTGGEAPFYIPGTPEFITLDTDNEIDKHNLELLRKSESVQTYLIIEEMAETRKKENEDRFKVAKLTNRVDSLSSAELTQLAHQLKLKISGASDDDVKGQIADMILMDFKAVEAVLGDPVNIRIEALRMEAEKAKVIYKVRDSYRVNMQTKSFELKDLQGKIAGNNEPELFDFILQNEEAIRAELHARSEVVVPDGKKADDDNEKEKKTEVNYPSLFDKGMRKKVITKDGENYILNGSILGSSIENAVKTLESNTILADELILTLKNS